MLESRWRFSFIGTKFGSEKGKVQKPARIPPQTPPAGGKKAEAGQFHSPRKIVYPAESKLVFRIFVKKGSDFVQKVPPCMGETSRVKALASLNLSVSNRRPTTRQGLFKISNKKRLL
jgi:hypothetical protein